MQSWSWEDLEPGETLGDNGEPFVTFVTPSYIPMREARRQRSGDWGTASCVIEECTVSPDPVLLQLPRAGAYLCIGAGRHTAHTRHTAACSRHKASTWHDVGVTGDRSDIIIIIGAALQELQELQEQHHQSHSDQVRFQKPPRRTQENERGPRSQILLRHDEA